MKYLFIALLLSIILASCSQTYYVVRHAEKETPQGMGTMMSNNPPLSENGRQRAEALKDSLKTKKIGYVFSTNTVRTLSTAEPVKDYFNLAIEIYEPVPNESLISRLLSLKKNALIVGHSNTVDDIVNKMCGSVKIPADLPDTAYDNLFVIRKKGKKMSFENRKFGNPSP
ncbi:MAG TPA: histidine phosphatase family protein [Chitinophagaceae bacterium]|nr:histidine phosphatase family protein [Chitinophagaceae bacterium]